MNKTVFLRQGIFLVLLLISCARNAEKFAEPEKVPVYHTWNSLKEREYGVQVSPEPLEIPPNGFFPWAGIASHHILSHDYLDAWFFHLAEMRKPKRFYILSPSHYGISLELFSLTTGSWESGFGTVKSDSAKVYKLAELLEVDLDPGVFHVEHGISTFIPYIKKYFPDASVVAIAYEAEPPVNIPLSRRLAEAIENEFDEEGKTENFLLISVDFSHHGSLEQTNIRDNYSEQYLRNTGDISWNMAGCDNRPGMYVLDRLSRNNRRASILYHTNSWEISKQGMDDITSYFFAYFSDI